MSNDNLLHPLPRYLIDAMQEIGRNIPRLRTADMVMRDAPVDYLLKGVLPRRGVAAIYGPPGSGKSFLATDLMFHSSNRSRLFFNRRLMAASVIYVGLEGQHGISQRMKAWEVHNGVEIGDRVGVLTEPFRLDDPSAVAELADEVVTWFGEGCVIIIDTLAQAMAGFDENNSAEMGAAISGAQVLAGKTRGLVILIHHSGKDVSKGLRGHSSLLGALDAAIEVKARAGGRSWKIVKSKDGEAGQEFGFELAVHTVGTDVDGDAITSCAVRPAMIPVASNLPQLNGRHRIAVMATMTALLSGSTGALPLDVVVAAVAPNLDCEPRRQLTVARETINRLVASGYLARDGDAISLPV